MTSTSTADPSKGLVYLTMKGVDAAGNPITVQGTGVLLSDDEVLTAAHLVYNDNGTLRTTGSAAVGYQAGSSIATSKIDGVQALAKSDYTTLAGIGQDYAVVHLSTPVSGGTIFSLGSDLPSGTFTLSGYPAGTSGSLDTKTELLSVASGTNIYTGGTLDDGTGNPDGSSGGAVYQIVNGVPTVYGVISADNTSDVTKGLFTQLTAADVTQLQAWVNAADQGAASVGATSQNSGSGFSQALADQLASDAANSSGRVQAVMTDVATAISQACSDGGTVAQMTQDAADYLSNNSSHVNRALAYLAGFISGTTNSWTSNLTKTTNKIVMGSIVNGVTFKSATAGRAEGFAATQSAPTQTILPRISMLANVISQNGVAATTGSHSQELPISTNFFAGPASSSHRTNGLGTGFLAH